GRRRGATRTRPCSRRARSASAAIRPCSRSRSRSRATRGRIAGSATRCSASSRESAGSARGRGGGRVLGRARGGAAATRRPGGGAGRGGGTQPGLEAFPASASYKKVDVDDLLVKLIEKLGAPARPALVQTLASRAALARMTAVMALEQIGRAPDAAALEKLQG